LVTSVLPSISFAFFTTSSTRLDHANATGCIAAQLLELALAAPARMDLRLDHVNRSRQRLGGRLGIISRHDCHTGCHGCAKFLQQRLGLILMNVHGLKLPFPPALGW
jgi:hypothetical protein